MSISSASSLISLLDLTLLQPHPPDLPLWVSIAGCLWWWQGGDYSRGRLFEGAIIRGRWLIEGRLLFEEYGTYILIKIYVCNSLPPDRNELFAWPAESLPCTGTTFYSGKVHFILFILLLLLIEWDLLLLTDQAPLSRSLCTLKVMQYSM